MKTKGKVVLPVLLTAVASVFLMGQGSYDRKGNCCDARLGPGCSDAVVEAAVVAEKPSCGLSWTLECVEIAKAQSCVGKECGDDLCGGCCGSCPQGQECADDICTPIFASCPEGQVYCGAVGCCAVGQWCDSGECKAVTAAEVP